MCNCGGTYPVRASGITNNDVGWAAAAGRDRPKFEVTFPDGTVREYDSDTEAYRAVRVRGGGIRQKAAA
jgi:phage baseplate assembly protein gpV